jgi:hypothetical protein
MRVVHPDRLTTYQETAQHERPSGGSSRSSWGVITTRTEPWGRERSSITDIISTALREEWWYTCRLFMVNSLKEGTMRCIDPLLGNDREINTTTAVPRQQPVNQWTGWKAVFSV